MYLDYWKLRQRPFDAVPDSRFFFSAPAHQHALAVLSFAARDSGEPVLAMGPHGCGKTLLLRALRRQLSPVDFHVAFVSELAGGQMGLLRRVAYALTHEVPADGGAAVDLVTRAAHEAEAAHRTLVVMLDDWPTTAPPEAFEELRWLLNLDLEHTGIRALFSAEPLDPRAMWPSWLQQRLCATVVIGPLETARVGEYLEHRLRLAGHADGRVFDASAASAIAAWSGGVPRLINRAAHLALQVGALHLAQQVNAEVVRRAFARLNGQRALNHAAEPAGEPA